MRVVIDTNCLLASIPPKSKYYWLYQAFKDERFDWLISNEILLEYIEKLSDIYSENTAIIVYSILSVAPNVELRNLSLNGNWLNKTLTIINLQT